MSAHLFNWAPAELEAVKARQKATWEAGDFGQVAKYNEPSAEEFMSRLPLRSGAQMLDVACGTGNLAFIAARKGCFAHGIDIAANLIAQAKRRAEAAALTIDYREGDAEALPFPDAMFDLVVSMYGVMFAPRPQVTADELLRVTKPGGMIALANWTPEGFIGKMFDVFKQFLPPTAGVPSPLLWGCEDEVEARLTAKAAIHCTRRMARLSYPFDAKGTVEFFRTYYGPTQRAFASLDEDKQAGLRKRLEQLQAEYNVSDDPNQTTTLAEYLEVIAVKRSP
jgi:SAM-dependent methyltransferase